MALRGGLPRRPGARARLGAEPGRGLARPGVRPDLAGRPLAGLAVRDGGGPPATVEGLDAFANVRPSRGEVPALVAGLPPPGTPAGTRLALALNGRVATVAEVAPKAATTSCGSPACSVARGSSPAPTASRSWSSPTTACAA
jgi:hypothetical protein